MDFYSLLQHLTSSAVPAPLNALTQSQGGANMLAQAGQPQGDLTHTFPAPPQVDWLSGVRGVNGAGPNGTAAYHQALETAFANAPQSPSGTSSDPSTSAMGDYYRKLGTQQKSPLQRLGEALMQTPNAPVAAPHMQLGNPNGNALLEYMQNSPFLRRRRPD
jgi:hypothetical protein